MWDVEPESTSHGSAKVGGLSFDVVVNSVPMRGSVTSLNVLQWCILSACSSFFELRSGLSKSGRSGSLGCEVASKAGKTPMEPSWVNSLSSYGGSAMSFNVMKSKLMSIGFVDDSSSVVNVGLTTVVAVVECVSRISGVSFVWVEFEV